MSPTFEQVESARWILFKSVSGFGFIGFTGSLGFLGLQFIGVVGFVGYIGFPSFQGVGFRVLGGSGVHSRDAYGAQRL